MSVYEIPADEYNEKLAEALKQLEEFEVPEWAEFVKTSVARKRPPSEEDFWYKRAASILRQLYIHGVVGVGRLRTRYGGRKNRGMKPEKFKKGSGKHIRIILQQAEAAGFVEKAKTTRRSGRRLTDKGKEFLDELSLLEKEKPRKEKTEMGKEEIKEELNPVKVTEETKVEVQEIKQETKPEITEKPIEQKPAEEQKETPVEIKEETSKEEE